MTSSDKLSVIIPADNIFLNDNLRILSLFTNKISCILITDNKFQFNKGNYKINFDLEIIELDKKIITGPGHIIYHVLKYIKTGPVLFLDEYTLINRSHFEYFLNTSLTLTKGFITGITLTKEGENWKPSQPVSPPSNQWENFEYFALSTSLAGGVIYHTDFIKKHQDYYYPENIFSDILLHWHLYSHRTNTYLPKVISLKTENTSYISTFYNYKLSKLLSDLEIILHHIKFSNEMLIGFYDFITRILLKSFIPQEQLTLRLELFYLIKSFLK